MIKHTEVNSSVIKSVAWWETGKVGTVPYGTLEIVFHSGKVYQYAEVPVWKADELLDTDNSVGSTYNNLIKGQHVSTELAAPTPDDPEPEPPSLNKALLDVADLLAGLANDQARIADLSKAATGAGRRGHPAAAAHYVSQAAQAAVQGALTVQEVLEALLPFVTDDRAYTIIRGTLGQATNAAERTRYDAGLAQSTAQAIQNTRYSGI